MNNISVNFITNTIVVTKSFFHAAMEFGSDEYETLKRVKEQNPSMAVAVRTSAKRTKKNENKGLTYSYMRDFIRVMDNRNLIAFENMIAFYKSVDYEGAGLYNKVKEWFLENYPRHREMIVERAHKAA